MIGDSCSSKFVMMWWIAFVVIVVMIEKVVLAVGAVVGVSVEK